MKELDLRNLVPFQRHKTIFEMWENLEEGDTLRITNDHEPKPLYYQFEAEHKGEFKWSYEMQGPVDWIFSITKLANNKTKIKNLIQKLKSEDDIKEVKKEGMDILRSISASDLAIIEQEIINEGVTRDDMRKLCGVHLEVMKENLPKPKDLVATHPISVFMVEHQKILLNMDNLKKVVAELEENQDYDNATIEKLKIISSKLVEADKHHKREEDVLFPELIKRGVVEPPAIMLEEHEDIIPKKHELFNTVQKTDLNYKEFVSKVKELSDFICEMLPDHIYKEDNILYQMALDVIPEEDWDELKLSFDEIGYCKFD